MIIGIFLKIGLKFSTHDPCLLSIIIDKPTSHKTISEDQSQLHVGLYVDDFVLYSLDPAQEALFHTLLQEHIQVDFMGYVKYFLWNLFTWVQNKGGNMYVHICQSAFTKFMLDIRYLLSINPKP